MSDLFAGRVALVTGASSGIGSEIATRLAAAGARVALVGRDASALEASAAALDAPTSVVVADLTEAEQCRAAVGAAVAHHRRLDIVVNAAGIIAAAGLETTTLEDWSAMMRINLDAPFLIMQAALPALQEHRGNVVNVSSVAGVRAFPGILAYCVSKAGVDQLTRCAALELAASGVRVNAVNPGVVVSNLHRRGGMQEEAYQSFLEHSKTTHPLGRVGEPGDIADAVMYLASDNAAWVTGVTLNLDGGRHLTCAR